LRSSTLYFLPTIECVVINRLNRFVVRIKVNGQEALAHTNNTGRLKDFIRKGALARCTEKYGGKTQYRLIAVQDPSVMDHRYALIDTREQMKGFENAVKQGLIPIFRKCVILRRNPRIGESVLDYKLACIDKEFFLEIKSAVQRKDKFTATFPDAPTMRGRRHLKEIIMLIKKGIGAGVLFIAGIPETKFFTPNDDIDPSLRALLKEIRRLGGLIAGVSMYYNARDESIVLENPELAILL